jgi:hypothetical protein
MRTLALERALVVDVAATIGVGVVDKQPMLVVLTGVGKEHAEQLNVSPGTGERGNRAQPNHVSPQGHRNLDQSGVSSDLKVLCREMYRVSGPVLQANQGEGGLVTYPHLKVLSKRGRAHVIQHDRGSSKWLHVDEGVAIGRSLTALTAHRDVYRFGQLGLGRHGYDCGMLRASKRVSRDSIRGDAHGPQSGVSSLHRFNDDGLGRQNLDHDFPARNRGVIVHPTQAIEWSKAPFLFASLRDREVRRIE